MKQKPKSQEDLEYMELLTKKWDNLINRFLSVIIIFSLLGIFYSIFSEENQNKQSILTNEEKLNAESIKLFKEIHKPEKWSGF